ncbi:TIGR02281 family clan AA aspartic protease [Amaricoccus sp.]|uniref:retropepsin-like aspartic protease family protein n=1 Tax=Amaricoccus sp. TaxID=1872485 RepID=UPI001B7965D3|nr:TIGR02281 family clan AA aspartic protease [Amaricoccus sp.]MBP7001371.1 TIGR02281 family clan AA aspartic protease [Amaricoccus sp.]
MPDNPDDLARLFYLALLLVGLLAFFSVGSRQRLGRTLQQLLVWALIFAMAVIAYGFRDTLRQGLFPSSAVMRADGAVELRRGADGHFHATLELNGAPVRFIVDTGASDMVLSRADAEKAGIDVAALAYTGRAITANGTVATAPARVRRVTLGDFAVTNVPASVTSGALETSLLGMTFLDRFARIEIEGDRMILRH